MSDQGGFPCHVVKGMNKMASEAADHPWQVSRKQEKGGKDPKNKLRQLDVRHKDVELRAREKGILKVLDEQFLRAEYKVDHDTEDTDILNVPKRNIEILGNFSLMLLTRLKVCNLANNFLTDITPLKICAQLVKLDVSNNQLGNIPGSSFWSGFTHLVVLYLHGNNLSRLSEVSSLQACVRLQVLTLCDTPMSLHKAYRHTAVNTIPSLKALDCFVISDEEIIEDFSLSGRFAALSRAFGINLYQPCAQPTTCAYELHQVACLLARVHAILARHSPVIVIQRYARGWLARRKMNKLSTPSSKPLGMSRQHSRYLKSSVVNQKGLPSPAHKSPVKEGRTDDRGPSMHAQEQLSQPASKGCGDLAVEWYPVVGKHQDRSKSKSSVTSPKDDKQRLSRGMPNSHPVPAMCICPSPSPSRQAAEGAGVVKGSAQQIQQPIKIPIQGPGTQPSGASRSRNSPRVHYKSTEAVEKKCHGLQPDKDVQEQLHSTSKKLAPVQGQRALGHVLVDLCKRDSPVVAQQEKQGCESYCEPAGEEEEEEEELRCELVGSAAQIQFHNPKVAMLLSRKLDSHLVRKAEAEIMNILSTQATQTVPRIPPSCHLLMKDDLDFHRMHESMSLSPLQTVEKAYKNMGKIERLRVQKELVSRKQTLRKEIKEKIEEHHQRKLDEVARWKEAHYNLVARAREHSFVEGDIKSSLHRGAMNCQQVLKNERRAEEGFVSQFSTINSSMGNSLKEEDNRLLREEQQAERTNGVQQLRRSNFITRAMFLSHQQEKAEATRLRSADMRHELMKLRQKNRRDQYMAAKQKVEAVKHSLHTQHPCDTRKMRVRFARSRVACPLSPSSVCALGARSCGIVPGPCGTVVTDVGSAGPKVVTLSLEDYDILSDSAVFLNHSLPPGRILKHFSFIAGDNEGNTYEDQLDPDLGIAMYGIGHTSDATVVDPSMKLSELYMYQV